MKFDPTSGTDFYKIGHKDQYPKDTEMVYSNLTARSNGHAKTLAKTLNGNTEYEYVVNFGLQYVIKHLLIDEWQKNFFDKPVEQVIAKYERRIKHTLGVENPDSSHFRALHNLGYLPIVIKALPEGAKVPVGVPFFTIKNTLPEFFWLTNFLETSLSALLWLPITSATTASHYKKLFNLYAEKTGSSPEFVNFQGHDFSFRGMSTIQAAALSGMGHLLSFFGTDTIPAIDMAEDYYNADITKEMVGCSVNATEHSVMCMGTMEDEVGTFRSLFTDIYPTGILSIVSDTWDFWKVVTEYLPIMKDEITARDGKVVIRPDSGDPVKIIVGEHYNTYDTIEEAKYAEEELMHEEASEACEGSYCMGNDKYSNICKVGDKFYTITAKFEYNRYNKQYYYVENYDSFDERVTAEEYKPTPEFKGAVQCLWDTFGGTVNTKGFKELDSHIGLIYGDSITLERAYKILAGLMFKGFAASNVVLGIGSFTYQYNTRDTHGFAIKSTAGIVKGELREIFKDPKTDSGLKKSAKGLLRVELEDGRYVLYDQQTLEQEESGMLQPIFVNGVLKFDDVFWKIRERVAQYA